MLALQSGSNSAYGRGARRGGSDVVVVEVGVVVLVVVQMSRVLVVALVSLKIHLLEGRGNDLLMLLMLLLAVIS